MTSEDWEERNRLASRTRKEFWANFRETLKNNWVWDTFPLAVVILFFVALFLSSCGVHEPLPGLCYTDKTGTYLCPHSCEEDIDLYSSAIVSCEWSPPSEIKKDE
jgi:hypothetical protein